MPRLLRPHVSVEVRCRTVLRQIGELWPDDVIETARKARSLGAQLRGLLSMLASNLGCDVSDLRLDHDPALAIRKKVFRKGVHVGYVPDACDPEHLIYRTAVAHHIKTNVRGDGAQHPDRVLIKKERRRQKKTGPAPRFRSAINKSKPKRKWASRPLRSAGAWPKGRKITQRRNT
jgi:hypothetical protein